MSRFVYLDEAGISHQKQEPWLVVGGVIVHGDTQLDKVYREIEAVGQKHLPPDYRESGVVLHAADVYGGNGEFDPARNPIWTWDKRKAILEDLAKIPNKANILITATPVERATFPSSLEIPGPENVDRNARKKQKRRPPSITVQAHAAAYLACLLDVDVWLRQNAKKENCMVIVEDNNEARAAIRQVHRYYQDKSMPVTDDIKQHFPLRRVREDPAFQEKRPDHPLILADFVAFIIKRIKMHDVRAAPFFAPWKTRLAGEAVAKHALMQD